MDEREELVREELIRIVKAIMLTFDIDTIKIDNYTLLQAEKDNTQLTCEFKPQNYVEIKMEGKK